MNCLQQKIGAGVLCWLLALSLPAQPIHIQATVDKNKVLLGEPFLLKLEVRSSGSSSLHLFKIDSLAHFEIIKQDSIARYQVGKDSVIRQFISLRSFDSGQWAIPPFIYSPGYTTNSLLVDVIFTENFNAEQPYHDIKDIYAVPAILNSDFEKWWYATAALFILITLLAYWLTQEKTIKNIQREKLENPYTKAIRLLTALKSSRADKKTLYAGLVEIFREYVMERTGIESLQQTSGDLLSKLKVLMPEEEKYRALSRVLALCDFVKFAKYNPRDEETVTAFEVITKATDYIEQEAGNKGLPKPGIKTTAE